jgi:hypothetical protein
MTSTAPPLPPSGGYLQAIRDSSRQLRISAGIRVSTPYVTDISLRSENIIKIMSVPLLAVLEAPKNVLLSPHSTFPVPGQHSINTQRRIYHVIFRALRGRCALTVLIYTFLLPVRLLNPQLNDFCNPRLSHPLSNAFRPCTDSISRSNLTPIWMS